MTKAVILAAALMALIPNAASFAQEEPQVVRQELMKGVGDATGVVGRMVRGDAAFDAALAIDALQTIQENSAVFADYFPVGSEAGFETEALPTIWADMDDFRARAEKQSADAAAAVAAAPADLDALRAAFQPVAANCRDCHETYRQSSN
jgi:cytochrome c556